MATNEKTHESFRTSNRNITITTYRSPEDGYYVIEVETVFEPKDGLRIWLNDALVVDEGN